MLCPEEMPVICSFAARSRCITHISRKVKPCDSRSSDPLFLCNYFSVGYRQILRAQVCLREERELRSARHSKLRGAPIASLPPFSYHPSNVSSLREENTAEDVLIFSGLPFLKIT